MPMSTIENYNKNNVKWKKKNHWVRAQLVAFKHQSNYTILKKLIIQKQP
jgi:hypothetical protein